MKTKVSNIKTMLESGAISYTDLSRRQKKQLAQSEAIPREARMKRSEEYMSKNEYVEVELPEPKYRHIKAECIHGEWCFSEKGWRTYIDQITSIYPYPAGREVENGVVIYRACQNEAVIYVPR